jgi:ABC-2 type transport system permease protein
MTWPLVRKLLRDVRLPLIVIGLLVGAFQLLWARITARILGKLAPFFNTLAGMGGLTPKDIEEVLFEGPGKIMRTIIGGERVVLDNAMDLLSIGYVHPLMVTVFCVWAIGRAAGAIAGEIDRGTMELLLAQPLARWRLILAHLLLDSITIPILCLSLWAGNWLGAWLVSPIEMEKPKIKLTAPQRDYIVELKFPFPLPEARVKVEDPLLKRGGRMGKPDPERAKKRLAIEPVRFGPALWIVGGLIFAVCGYTMWLSSAGRFRWRVLGVAVFVTLVQFLVNVLAQMWDQAEWLRPLTIFYYYQPQQVIQSGDWCVTLAEWNGGSPLVRLPMPVVLYGVGLIGYAMALWTLVRRDLPAPL